jgi:hypothetical protein
MRSPREGRRGASVLGDEPAIGAEMEEGVDGAAEGARPHAVVGRDRATPSTRWHGWTSARPRSWGSAPWRSRAHTRAGYFSPHWGRRRQVLQAEQRPAFRSRLQSVARRSGADHSVRTTSRRHIGALSGGRRTTRSGAPRWEVAWRRARRPAEAEPADDLEREQRPRRHLGACPVPDGRAPPYARMRPREAGRVTSTAAWSRNEVSALMPTRRRPGA